MVKNEIAQTIKVTRQMQVVNDLAIALKKNAKVEFVDESYAGSEFEKLLQEGVED